MSNDEHPLPVLLAELADFEEALAVGTYDLTDDCAFSSYAKDMASYKWAKIYLQLLL